MYKNILFLQKNTIFEQKSHLMLEYGRLKQTVLQAGFDLCGVARVRRFDDDAEFFGRWLDAGYDSSLDYLRRNAEKRFDASALVEGVRTVVVCAVNYRNALLGGYPDGFDAKVASYACAADYHTTIRSMLHRAFEALQGQCPSLRGRAFTDSAPLLEKRYAVEAGLGWIGRQSLLVTPRFGTCVLLGELLLDAECDRYDAPMQGVGCGTCRRCVDACPNGAVRERHIDTSRCISCATIERRNPSLPLHGWIFGCDECQSACPFNVRTEEYANAAFEPVFDPLQMDAGAWLALSDEEFSARFSSTPLLRSGLSRIKENAGK